MCIAVLCSDRLCCKERSHFLSGDRLFSFATAAMCCVSIAHVSPFLSSDRLFVHAIAFLV